LVIVAEDFCVKDGVVTGGLFVAHQTGASWTSKLIKREHYKVDTVEGTFGYLYKGGKFEKISLPPSY